MLEFTGPYRKIYRLRYSSVTLRITEFEWEADPVMLIEFFLVPC